jgi:hypothetical protein
MNVIVYEGGCLCGAVRYRIQGTPARRPWCHCSLCRRAAGAPVVAWATVGADAFAFTKGAPARYVSSAWASREFCGRCGSQLTFRYNDRPAELDVTLATLDDPARLPPTHHCYAPDRLPWVLLDDDLPRYDTVTSRAGPG